MTPLGKYIWLIKLLQGTDGMTFEEINQQWLKDRRNTEDENMPILKRTFHNHIKAIREEYDIYIECGRGYKYYIADADSNLLTKVNLLSTLNILNETVTDKVLSKNVVFDESCEFYRDQKVMTILDAIKTRHKVKLANFRNVNQPDKYQVLFVAPYQLHQICSQWYLIGQTDEFGLMRIPLKYYRGVHSTNASYKYPAKHSAEDYSKLIYGTSPERISLTVQIKSYNPQEYNFSNIPLMPFQKDVEYKSREEGERIFDFIDNNYVNIDFELPKSPFALYILKNRLEKYRYKILNDTNLFSLFTEEQYQEEIIKPVVL